MTEYVKPDWLQNHKNEPPTIGNPGWHKGMKSPNPTGRPKGIVDKRMRVTQALSDQAQAIVNVVNAAALAGDMQAAALVLARVAPAIKAQSQTVQFDFNASGSLTEQVEQVLQGIADGAVPPCIGKQIIESIGALSGIRAVEELEERLSALEGRR